MIHINERPSAVIIGADSQGGYAIARSLAYPDIRRIGICENPNLHFCRSHLWSSLVRIENYKEETILEKLIFLGKHSSNQMVLFPGNDMEVRMLSENANVLREYYAFVYPDETVIDLLIDKSSFYKWADQKGFPIPESYTAKSEKELTAIVKDIRYPIIIKPYRHTREWLLKKGLKNKVLKCDNKTELDRIGFDLFKETEKIIVQRWIPGGDENVHFCLLYIGGDGQERGYFTGRKLLQYPVLKGVTAIGAGTFNDDVHELARDVLLEAGARGLCSLELKKSERDNQCYITEPTIGRVDNQSYISVVGGVNLPLIAFYDALGIDHRVPCEIKKKTVWIEGHYTLLSIGHLILNRKFLFSRILKELNFNMAFAILNLNDPLPYSLHFIRSLIKPFVSLKRWLRIRTRVKEFIASHK